MANSSCSMTLGGLSHRWPAHERGPFFRSQSDQGLGIERRLALHRRSGADVEGLDAQSYHLD
jgi:hypothetical protein